MKQGAALKQLLAILFLYSGTAYANAIIFNAGFDTGGMTGWTPFTTSKGLLGTGMPTVISFDTTGNGASDAAEFQVGQVVPAGLAPEGGGIYQTVLLPSSGTYTISADIAAGNLNAPGSVSGGIAELLFDMQPVFGYNLGDLSEGEVVRQAITANVIAGAGTHSFGIQFLNPVVSSTFSPYQYVDNYWVEDPVDAPEPSTFLLLFFGLAILARRGRFPTGRSIRPRIF